MTFQSSVKPHCTRDCIHGTVLACAIAAIPRVCTASKYLLSTFDLCLSPHLRPFYPSLCQCQSTYLSTMHVPPSHNMHVHPAGDHRLCPVHVKRFITEVCRRYVSPQSTRAAARVPARLFAHSRSRATSHRISVRVGSYPTIQAGRNSQNALFTLPACRE